MEKITIKVEGMHCEGCENRIINSLKSIGGVEDVTANHEDGIVVVIANKIDRHIIEETIEDIGFKVKEN